MLIPPLNFQTLHPSRIHRGSYPREINYTFLKRLRLKTILSLTPNPITIESDPELYHFAKRENIKLIHLNCSKEDSKVKRKKRGINIDKDIINEALQVILSQENSSIYIHCLNGGQISSVIIAIYRKLSFWSTVSIFNEYLIFNGNSLNIKTRQFIEEFKIQLDLDQLDLESWLWKGLNKQIVDNHPTLQYIRTKSEKYRLLE